MRMRWTMLLLIGVILGAVNPFLLGQAPDLSQGKEIWRGEVEGKRIRVVQMPRRAAALIPLRLIVVEEAAGGGVEVIERVASMQIRPVEGAEALLAYRPSAHPVRFWRSDQFEVRETFRSAGTYEIRAVAEDGRQLFSVPIVVSGNRNLQFGEEFGFFVLGCLMLGAVLISILFWLGRREERRDGPVAAPQANV
jgi:hypothetical protein